MLLFIYFYREFLVTNLLFFLIGGNCSITLCFLSASSSFLVPTRCTPRPSCPLFRVPALAGYWTGKEPQHVWPVLGELETLLGSSAPPGCPLEAAACPQWPPLGGEDIRHARLSALGLPAPAWCRGSASPLRSAA